MRLYAEDFRRCINCGGTLIRVTDPEQTKRHVGHRVVYAGGLHINEYVRILIGWL